MSKLLTVIIPIYNVEDYLRQCLDSLCNQTNQNFKVIMVNDGSNDSSGIIAKEYCKSLPEMFFYFEQENKGQGAARNLGLQNVDTPYVTFLDSDDWWKSRNMEQIEKAILSRDILPDLIFTCPSVFDMATNSFSEWRDNEYVKALFTKYGSILSPHEITELYGTEASICRIVIKSEILAVNHFRFPEGIKWEDVYAHFVFLNWCHHCVLEDRAGFVYRINSGSQTTQLSDKRRLDIAPAFAEIFSFAFENEWTPAEIAYIFMTMMSFISWFLKATSRVYFAPLIECLHKLAIALPDECFEYYTKIFNPNKEQITLWYALKSKCFYRLIKSPFRYDSLKRIFWKMKNRRK